MSDIGDRIYRGDFPTLEEVYASVGTNEVDTILNTMSPADRARAETLLASSEESLERSAERYRDLINRREEALTDPVAMYPDRRGLLITSLSLVCNHVRYDLSRVLAYRCARRQMSLF